MITIEARQVQLHTNATNKQDAIRQVGQLLVNSGFIEAGYINSMLGREQVANTYLGNGIAIPHGLPEDRDLIKRTGVAVVQAPAGVTWNPGETAQLIVGIAAKSDEHIEVLRRLTRVLGNQEQVARLTQTTDPRDIIEALTGERPAAPLKSEGTVDYASYFDVVIHQGTDADAALAALRAAIASGLGDEPEQEQPASANIMQGWMPQAAGETFSGVSASSGLAIGVTRQYRPRTIVVEDQPGDPLTEGNRFQEALNAAQGELGRLYEEVKTRLGSGKAAIFRVHAELLSDAGIIQQTILLVYQQHSAAWAWQQIINERVSQMQKLDDPVLAGRAVDLSDVGQRVLRHLVGMPEDTVAPRFIEGEPLAGALLETPVILIAEDLTPSDTAALDSDTILGFCTVKGGPTSHTAILARSLGIPAVVGAGEALLDVPNGTPGILDGSNGRLYLKPSEADVRAAQALQQQLQLQQDEANTTRFAPAITSDGHRVEVAANINRAADTQQAVEAGAEGVGLMRTEFLFLERSSVPTEDEQFEAYRDMVQALSGRPLIIRTLDIGGDKEVPYLNLPKEDNSFLGIRGIRFCLARPDLFIPQLRALYRAAAYGPLSIMFPMISTLEDWRQARDIAERVRQELNAPQVPLGIMIEVPSAAILADQFAQEVDFFSIGTNDLTQYTLAMDRLHPQLAKQADGLHPAVLRMVESTIQAARKAGKWVGVCGGIAGDLQGAVILTGLGVSELSVGIPSIAAIKAHIRGLSLAEMQRIAQQALQCRTAAEVRNL